MKLGLQLNAFDWEGGPERFGRTLAEIARTAEEAGFDRIGVADHLWQHPIMDGPVANEPECYAMLSFVAANTEHIELTAMVTGVHFRHPSVLIKAVTTLTFSPEDAPGSASGAATTRRRPEASASPSRRRGSASRWSRRRPR